MDPSTAICLSDIDSEVEIGVSGIASKTTVPYGCITLGESVRLPLFGLPDIVHPCTY
jgi:hypothetical protein